MANDLTLSLGFEVDTSTIQTALQDQLGEFSKGMTSLEETIQALRTMLSDLATPMSTLRDLARDTAQAFADMKTAAQTVKDTVTTTSIQTGGAGGAGGGLGAIGGAISGGGGLLGAVGGLLSPITSSAGFGLLRTGAQGLLAGGALAFLEQTGVLNDISQIPGMFRTSFPKPPPMDDPAAQYRGVFAPFEALASGMSPLEMSRRLDPGTLAGAYGFWRGAISGIGAGPVGLISQTFGGAYGAAQGEEFLYDIVQRYAPRALQTEAARAGVRTTGAELGRALVAGTEQSFIQDAMARFPQYLATAASIASTAQFGVHPNVLRSMAVGWGVSPDQFGPEFAAFAQGIGTRDPDQIGRQERGGEIGRRLGELSLAYSRAYGVGMGAAGAAVGNLLQIGGGGQYLDPSQREEALLRVMTEAVSVGFGRRLPEFAQTISSGMQIAFSGPALIGNAAAPEMISQFSRLQADVMREYNVGLVGAQRVMAPFQAAPGNVLRGLLSGGGDPFAMAAFVSYNRDRFGGDIGRLQEEIAGVAERPFSADALRMWIPMLTDLTRRSIDPAGERTTIWQTVTGLTGQQPSWQGVERFRTEGIPLYQRIRGEGRDPTEAEYQRIALGLSSVTPGGDERLLEGRRNIETQGRDVMREHLGAVRENARFQEQQYRISAEMAPVARQFYSSMLHETQGIARLLATGALAQTITAVNALRERAAETVIAGGTVSDWARIMIQGIPEVTGSARFADMIESMTGRARREAQAEEAARNVIYGPKPLQSRVDVEDWEDVVVRDPASSVTELLRRGGSLLAGPVPGAQAARSRQISEANRAMAEVQAAIAAMNAAQTSPTTMLRAAGARTTPTATAEEAESARTRERLRVLFDDLQSRIDDLRSAEEEHRSGQRFIARHRPPQAFTPGAGSSALQGQRGNPGVGR